MNILKNIEISHKTNADLQRGESLFKYWIIAFVAVAWFTRSEGATHYGAEPVHLYHAVYHTAPGQDSSTLNLILDWLHD